MSVADVGRPARGLSTWGRTAGAVTHLAACKARAGLIVSVATRDDAVRVWCVCGYGTAAAIATFNVGRPTVAVCACRKGAWPIANPAVGI